MLIIKADNAVTVTTEAVLLGNINFDAFSDFTIAVEALEKMEAVVVPVPDAHSGHEHMFGGRVEGGDDGGGGCCHQAEDCVHGHVWFGGWWVVWWKTASGGGK